MPFPALTVCNMGQVRKSEMQKIPNDSIDYYIAKSICRQELNEENNTFAQKGTWPLFRKMLLKVQESMFLEYKPFFIENITSNINFGSRYHPVALAL